MEVTIDIVELDFDCPRASCVIGKICAFRHFQAVLHDSFFFVLIFDVGKVLNEFRRGSFLLGGLPLLSLRSFNLSIQLPCSGFFSVAGEAALLRLLNLAYFCHIVSE